MPPSTVGSVSRPAQIHIESDNSYVLYNDSIALRVLWDGIYAYCQLLDHSKSEPWTADPISYWTMWHFQFLGAGSKWREDVPDTCIFSNAYEDETGAYLTQDLHLPTNNSTVRIVYKLLNDGGKLKWDIVFTAGANKQYRLAYRVDSIPSQHIRNHEKKKIRFNFGIHQFFGEFLNDFLYEDVDETLYPITDTYLAGDRRSFIYIALGNLGVGEVIEFDPSTAGTSTSSLATRNTFQRKSFHANGLFWVFYSDGTDMVYNTSSDGSSWNAKVTARAGVTEGFSFSIWFDGTFLHYVYAKNSAVLYRRGSPEANGTITWSAVEQTVQAGTNNDPNISVDTDGYPWIGYRVGTLPYVTKSSANDGTWTTAVDFPYQLTTTTASDWYVTPIPLTDLKMLVIYAVRNVTIKSKKYDGSWGDEKTTTSSLKYEPYYSAVAQGDNVHLVFMKVTTFDILHTQYTYVTDAWSAETTVRAAVTGDSSPALSIDTVTNNLYCFWMGSPTAHHVYYKKRIAGNWDTDPTDWIDESGDSLTGVNTHTSFYKEFGSKIGLVYMTKIGSPYNIRFAFLSFIDLAGTIPATSVLSGAMKVARKLVGTISAQATVSGALSTIKKIIGSITAQSVVSGVLKPFKGIVGSISAQSSLTGAIQRLIEDIPVRIRYELVSKTASVRKFIKKLGGR